MGLLDQALDLLEGLDRRFQKLEEMVGNVHRWTGRWAEDQLRPQGERLPRVVQVQVESYCDDLKPRHTLTMTWTPWGLEVNEDGKRRLIPPGHGDAYVLRVFNSEPCLRAHRAPEQVT